MARLRQVVGSGRGMGDWVGQLLTAVLMLVCLVYLLVVYAMASPSGHAELAALLGADHFRVPASFAMLALVWHAWLGAKSVVMDYIKWPWMRVAKYVGSAIFFPFCLIWFLGVVWSL